MRLRRTAGISKRAFLPPPTHSGPIARRFFLHSWRHAPPARRTAAGRFNYFGIMMGVAFDWAYWFLTALCFRPCDYAQLWETETGFIYSITDRAFQVT